MSEENITRANNRVTLEREWERRKIVAPCRPRVLWTWPMPKESKREIKNWPKRDDFLGLVLERCLNETSTDGAKAKFNVHGGARISATGDLGEHTHSALHAVCTYTYTALHHDGTVKCVCRRMSSLMCRQSRLAVVRDPATQASGTRSVVCALFFAGCCGKPLWAGPAEQD
jgi:hypothetical protein